MAHYSSQALRISALALPKRPWAAFEPSISQATDLICVISFASILTLSSFQMNLIPILRKNLTNLAYHRRIRCSISRRLFATTKEQELVPSPAILDLLLNKHQFSPKVATKAAAVLSRVEDLENSDSVLSFLKESGFSNAQLEKVVTCRPRVLLSSLDDTVKPKIRALQDLGFCSNDIAKIVSSASNILHKNFRTSVVPSLSVLKGILGTDDDVVKLVRRFAWLLNSDLQRTLVLNVEFLKSYGIPMERISILLRNAPFSLLLKPEVIRKSVERAERMGANRSSNMFVSAVQVCSISEEAWELKLQAFRNWGFSESDIMRMFVQAPMVFSLSVENLARKIDVLLATRKYNISCIINDARSLTYSVEKRYKLRFQILDILERKNLIQKWPALGKICRMTDKNFFEKFFGPYLSEVGDLYIAKSSAMAKRDTALKKWN